MASNLYCFQIFGKFFNTSLVSKVRGPGLTLLDFCILKHILVHVLASFITRQKYFNIIISTADKMANKAMLTIDYSIASIE